MKKDFFVMLTTSRGNITPLVINDEGDLALFETEEEAIRAASKNSFGGTFGYEVFKRGTGESG